MTSIASCWASAASTPSLTICSATRCSAINRSPPTIASWSPSTRTLTAARGITSRSIRRARWATVSFFRATASPSIDRGTASGTPASNGTRWDGRPKSRSRFTRSISIRRPRAGASTFSERSSARLKKPCGAGGRATRDSPIWRPPDGSKASRGSTRASASIWFRMFLAVRRPRQAAARRPPLSTGRSAATSCTT